ncbi:unnamed protein product, partial [marine sediment metagenome]
TLGWQDYDVSGSGFVSDHFCVELWQTAGFGYICSDTEGTLHYMSEVSTDRGVTWPIWADMNFMIRASVTPVSIPATVDIDPDTLNLKSNGQWITAYIELPGYDVNDIDMASIMLTTDFDEGFTKEVDLEAPIAFGDYDEDGIPDLMVKFDRAALVNHLGEPDIDGGDKFYNVLLTVTGKLLDETPFGGTDIIRVLER